MFVPHIEEGRDDGFLLTDDLAPNTQGALIAGAEAVDASVLKDRISRNSKALVIMLSDSLIDRGVLDTEDLSSCYTILFATNENETTQIADLVIPITCIAEHAASYVNTDGRIQRSFPAKETRYSNRRLNLEMSQGRLDRYGTSFDNWVTEDNKIDCLPLWEILHHLGELTGLKISYPGGGREIFSEMSNVIPLLSDVSYERMDEEKGVKLDLDAGLAEQKK
ncbi:MAG: molybdopterin-dependent oxidoreductase, partial [Balneolaceae bacterium]